MESSEAKRKIGEFLKRNGIPKGFKKTIEMTLKLKRDEFDWDWLCYGVDTETRKMEVAHWRKHPDKYRVELERMDAAKR